MIMITMIAYVLTLNKKFFTITVSCKLLHFKMTNISKFQLSKHINIKNKHIIPIAQKNGRYESFKGNKKGKKEKTAS